MPLVPILLVVVGIGCLTVGADFLVRGASGIAERFGLSRLVIGLTVVAFGTSFPETAVSVGSALGGEGEVALGNAIGSNIFNILVVLGGAAILRPMAVHRQLVRFDVPVMIATAGLVWLLVADHRLGVVDGAALLFLSVLYTVYLIRSARGGGEEEDASPEPSVAAEGPGEGTSMARLGISVAVGLLLLGLGARWLVAGATDIARGLGVSELVIGLTVVAVGTSLPEVATSFLAAMRGMRDIAVGNVIGSNVFNALVVLGAAGVVSSDPIVVPQGVLTFDLPIMLGASLVCLPVFYTGWSISRREGVIFVGYYLAYLAYLILHQADHAADDVLRDALLFYVAPATAVALTFAAAREWARRRAED